MTQTATESTAGTAAAPAEAHKYQAINPSRLKLGEYIRNIFTATAHEGTLVEDALNPEYWAHVSEQFKPYDKIELRADDGSWYAEFMVLDASRTWARVKLLNQWDLTTADTSLSQATLDAYRFEFKGPHKKWCVIRNSDDAYVHEQMASKGDAMAAIGTLLKAGAV